MIFMFMICIYVICIMNASYETIGVISRDSVLGAVSQQVTNAIVFR